MRGRGPGRARGHGINDATVRARGRAGNVRGATGRETERETAGTGKPQVDGHFSYQRGETGAHVPGTKSAKSQRDTTNQQAKRDN